LTDPNEPLDQDQTPPDGYVLLAESTEGQPSIGRTRIDRRVLLVGLVTLIILSYTGFILVSLATGDHSNAIAQFNPGNRILATPTVTIESTLSPSPPKVEPAATPVSTSQPPAVPTSTTLAAPTSPPIPTPTTEPSPNLCGAPTNPYGYNFCGGSLIYSPASDICSYLTCAANFWKSDGYVVQCQDDTFSKTGGKQKVCSQDQGYRETLFR
jgi:hypothetical protein